MSDEANAARIDGEAPAKPAFGRAFWMCNSIEMFERLAYFGIRSVVPIYIMQATEPGGLHLTAIDKGWIYMWWAVVQSWLPMFTGGIADRYGYKRILVGAISTNVLGYLVMAWTHSYHGFFTGILLLAAGTAFFKPALQGSIAQNLTKANSSVGWGLFYWVVNVGAVMAPVLATMILGIPHSADGWRNLFLASAGYTCANLLLLLTFKDVPSGSDKTQSLFRVFGRTFENIWFWWFVGGQFVASRVVIGLIVFLTGFGVVVFKSELWFVGVGLLLAGSATISWLRGGKFTWQLRLPAFLGIMSCFWLMMYQLWDLHPNFITDWIDSSMVAAHAPEAWREYGDRGLVQVPQQILLNLNAALIVALVVPLSWLVRKMRTLSAMLIGMSVATIGILVAGLTGNGWILLLGIFFFSLGEMLTGPKKNEYLGLIAPPGKKALYLGYVNIPIGIGVGIGSMIAGVVYDNYGEKASLALDHLAANPSLVSRAARSVDWSDSLETLPPLLEIQRGDALEVAADQLGQDERTAAETLKSAFRYDDGQIVNLGLQFIAVQDSYSTKTATRLAEARQEGPADDVKTATEGRLARFVHLIPAASGVHRSEVWEILRSHFNDGVAEGDVREDSDIIDQLWSILGDDRDNLDNLALEYLAQGTGLLEEAVGRMAFGDPRAEIEERVGIGRTKSFEALSSALGGSQAAIESLLAGTGGGDMDTGARALAYLAQQRHHRFNAVARQDWRRDAALLKSWVELDTAAAHAATEALGGSLDYDALAGDQDAIQAALAAKNWSRDPQHAAQLLRLNPFAALNMVGAEVNRSRLATTQLLWEEYHPQYKVWIPFAVIGVFAAIALAIFGQMAKRWADMNA